MCVLTGIVFFFLGFTCLSKNPFVVSLTCFVLLGDLPVCSSCGVHGAFFG